MADHGSEYGDFVSAHEGQLERWGVPNRLWTHIFQKLCQGEGGFDAGAYFVIQVVEERIVGAESDVGTSSDAPGADGDGDGDGNGADGELVRLAYEVVTTRNMDALATVFLVDHAWSFLSMDQAAAQLAHLPEHLARMEAMILGDDGTRAISASVDDRVRAVMAMLPHYTHSLVDESGERVLFVMDEFGSRLTALSDDAAANFRVVPFQWHAPPTEDGKSVLVPFTILWPVVDVPAGSVVYTNALEPYQAHLTEASSALAPAFSFEAMSNPGAGAVDVTTQVVSGSSLTAPDYMTGGQLLSAVQRWCPVEQARGRVSVFARDGTMLPISLSNAGYADVFFASPDVDAVEGVMAHWSVVEGDAGPDRRLVAEVVDDYFRSQDLGATGQVIVDVGFSDRFLFEDSVAIDDGETNTANGGDGDRPAESGEAAVVEDITSLRNMLGENGVYVWATMRDPQSQVVLLDAVNAGEVEMRSAETGARLILDMKECLAIELTTGGGVAFYISTLVLRSQTRSEAKLVTLEAMCTEYRAQFPGADEMSVGQYVNLCQRMGQPPITVDVRPKAERSVSMLPNAISKGDFEGILAAGAVDPDMPVVAYCTVGFRSLEWAQAMKESHPELSVWSLRGSCLAWAHNQLAFVDSIGAETRDLHCYGAKWNLAPNGYETIW